MRVWNRVAKVLVAAILLVAAVLLTAPSAWAQGENYDIYLLAGQSNADGRGVIEGVTDQGQFVPGLVGDLAQYALPQPEHRIYFSNPGISDDIAGNPEYVTGWQTLQPGFSIEPGFRGPLGDFDENGIITSFNTNTFGPEVSFASEIAEATGTTNNVGIIKVTDGGTSLAVDWRAPGSDSADDEGGLHYALLVSQALAALEALEAEGNTGTIRGLVWHQGESDSSSARASQYQDRFENFVAQLQEDLDLEELPTVIGELAPSRPNNGEIAPVLASIAADNDSISLTSSVGLESVSSEDLTHFNTASQIELGRRFAQDLALLVIPEPATLAMMWLPLVALASRRRR